MKFGVLQFPGSCDDRDALAPAVGSPTRDSSGTPTLELGDVDVVVVPGGFSYGDYLRAGAIARFAPAMEAVARHAEAGGLVLGICNGFQVLCEAGLLPGALLPNDSLRFVCRQVERGGGERRDAVHPRYPSGAAALDPGQAPVGALLRPAEQLRGARGAGRDGASLRAGQQPERVGARDRRDRQRARQRDGADAPPRARRGPADRLRGRAGDLQLAGRLGRAAATRRRSAPRELPRRPRAAPGPGARSAPRRAPGRSADGRTRRRAGSARRPAR